MSMERRCQWVGLLADKEFKIGYNDLTKDAQRRYDEFCRSCGLDEGGVVAEHDNEAVATVTELDFDF
jgi:hypothetical protein